MVCVRCVRVLHPAATVAVFILVTVGIICSGLLMGLDDRFIFHPLPFDRMSRSSLPAGGLSVEDHTFPTNDDLELHGWFSRARPTAPWLIWCHGNSGNVTHRAHKLRLLVEQGFNVFIFDYRGYGRSEGHPSEEGLYHDAVAAYDYLRSLEQLPVGRMILYGSSLGAPVAAELALRRSAAGLIMETPLASITAMARTIIPVLPIEILFRSRFDTLARAPDLELPTLVLIAEHDEVIPPSHGYQLFRALPGPKEIWTIPGAGHNDAHLVGGQPYFTSIANFVRRATDRGHS